MPEIVDLKGRTYEEALTVPGVQEHFDASRTAHNYQGPKARRVSWKILGPFLWKAWRGITPTGILLDELERPMEEAWRLVGKIWKRRKERPAQWAALLEVLRALAGEDNDSAARTG